MRPSVPLLLLILLPAALLAPTPALAYRDDTLQELTFLAAKRFNRCVEGTEVPRLSALQVRNLVRGDLSEAGGAWRHFTNWTFYDRGQQDPRRLLWSIDTRLHERFQEVVDAVFADDTRTADRYMHLGEVIQYIQTVTIPADVVPIFHPRPWRWPSGDRFSQYPVDAEELSADLGNLCPELLATPADESFETLLDRTAAATMAAIRAPIADMNASWNVFWQEDEPGRFGSYGPAGNNFGKAARFPCGEDSCVLLDDDPIYREFALTQHRLAVLGTMRAVLVLQRHLAKAASAPAASAPAASEPAGPPLTPSSDGTNGDG